jgi:hypothetical protein
LTMRWTAASSICTAEVGCPGVNLPEARVVIARTRGRDSPKISTGRSRSACAWFFLSEMSDHGPSTGR